ncbi:T9SS type A sorting domain-containing protein, partial [Candidatus Marinimicrobia bacterium MT.SAG.4]
AELAGLISDEVYYWRVGAVDIEELETFSSIDSFSTLIVGVEPGTEQAIPTTYDLSQNYPNPFNPVTVIRYALPKSSDVSLVIYNLMGQEVMRWDENNVRPGYYEKTWKGTTGAGIPVSSGMYIYRIIAGDFVQTRKMVLLK